MKSKKEEKIVKGYKAFNIDLKCRDFQYEIGETYSQKEKPKCCNNGFHFCEYPLDIFNYYEPGKSRFCEIEALGDVDKEEGRSDTKCSTNKIKIGAELNFKSLAEASIAFIYEHTKKDNKKSAHKEEDNSVASNSGNHSVSSNSGDYSVSSNSGNHSVSSNSGNHSVSSNSGYQSVSSNSGNHSVSSNSGNHSVSSNSGDYSVSSNSGNHSVSSNSGDYSVSSNSGNHSVSSNSGQEGIAFSSGIEGRAKGSLGNWLVLAEWYQDDNYDWHIKEVKSVKVDGEKIKADTLYQLVDGKFVEVK